jgi:hypothetical protein
VARGLNYTSLRVLFSLSLSSSKKKRLLFERKKHSLARFDQSFFLPPLERLANEKSLAQYKTAVKTIGAATISVVKTS